MATNYYAVENKDQDPADGLHLGRYEDGSVFLITWHNLTWKEHQPSSHPYRNFDEFKQYIRDKTIKTNRDEIISSDELINIIESSYDKYEKTPDKFSSSIWIIDGYYFFNNRMSMRSTESEGECLGS